jgi:hypothetical protein
LRTRFNDDEVEIIEAFITVVCRMLDIDRVVWTRSKDTTGKWGKKDYRPGVGESNKKYFQIWLDEKDHLKDPWIETLDTVLHEILHIKFPHYNEKQILRLSFHYTNIIQDKKRKKKNV